MRLETVLQAERAMNDYRESLVKNYWYVKTPFESLPLTASEEFMFAMYRRRFESAKREYYQRDIADQTLSGLVAQCKDAG